MDSSSATLNSWLKGSPYSFPEDESGEQLASSLLRDQLRLVSRHAEVQRTCASWSASIREELDRDFAAKLVFESNAIEGITVSFPQTQELLNSIDTTGDYLTAYSFRQQIIEDRKLLEVVGHGEALRFVRDLAGRFESRPLREVDIRDIHRLAMASEPRIAGSYKTTDNAISGREDLLTARSDDVGHHMHSLVEWLAQTPIHGPLVAAVVHAWLAYLHPFEDGNGRVARLLANYVLYRHRWPSLIVRSGAERSEYYEALQHSDEGGDIGPLFSLFVKGLDRTLTEMCDPEFARMLIAADLRKNDRFDLWSALHAAFTSHLSSALQARRLSFEVVGWLSASDFLYLERRDASGNGWFAKVRSPDRKLDLLLWFGYQSDDLLLGASSGRSPTPSIFFSERDRAPLVRHPYRWLPNDRRLDVHEVSLIPVRGHNRVLVRSGTNVTSTDVVGAAERVANALARLTS